MTARLPSAVRWLLVGSLALNVALLAGLGWEHLGPRPHHGPPRHHLRTAMLPSPHMLRGAVPESRRATVDQVLQRHRRPIRESVRDVFEARARVHALLTAERIDPAALDRAFTTLRERDARAAGEVQAMLTELVQRLTPEERRALAEAMQPRHRLHRRTHRDAPRRPPEP